MIPSTFMLFTLPRYYLFLRGTVSCLSTWRLKRETWSSVASCWSLEQTIPRISADIPRWFSRRRKDGRTLFDCSPISVYLIYVPASTSYKSYVYNVFVCFFIPSFLPGAQVGEKATDGTSALLAALNSGCTDCEQLLLSMGADHPIESDEDGQSQTAARLN